MPCGPVRRRVPGQARPDVHARAHRRDGGLARHLHDGARPPPPGARAKTHLHRGIETAAYVVDGRAEMFFGPRLEHHVDAAAGDYIYIPADVAHLVMNRSGAPATALVAHTAASDQEGIVLLPDLDPLIP